VVHVLSREHQDVELFNGRITREKCDRLFERWIDVEGVDAAFVCGPHGMVEEVTASLRAHGLAADRIKFELFGTPADLGAPAARAAEGDAPARAPTSATSP
jgi:ring-1,2-phenylacetyl-CoA epoxidase subunit PaaE